MRDGRRVVFAILIAMVSLLALLVLARVTARADAPAAPAALGQDAAGATSTRRYASFAASGRITTTDGTPLAGVYVMSGPNAVTTTDADGRYTLHDLGEGTAVIVPVQPGYVFTPATRSVSPPPDPTGQDFVAARGPTVWLPALSQAVAPGVIAGPWIAASSPVSTTLRSIAVGGAGDGWAVGDLGHILRLTGGAWREIASPTAMGLNGVALSAPGDGWAVGDSGVLVKLTGNLALQVDSPTPRSLYAVALSAADEGWAVGDGTASNALWDDADTILRLHGGAWSVIRLPAAEQKLPQPPITRWLELRCVALVGPNDGWAVGFDASSTYPGVFGHGARLEAGAWGVADVTRPPGRLNAIALLGPDSGWIVGKGGSIFSLANGSVTPVSSPTTADLNAIALSGPDDGWAVGAGGTILRLAHGQWYQATSPTHAALYGVALSGPASGWIVGENGTLLVAP
ncbi:MAG: hypothetical protein U0768_21940 [Anaerolineae bacterium]